MSRQLILKPYRDAVTIAKDAILWAGDITFNDAVRRQQ
jgi:hypothetical protein